MNDVEDREQLAYARDERDLLGFPRRHEALIEGANHGVPSGGHEVAHVERRAHGGAAAPDESCAAARATVAGERRHADERGDAFPVQSAQLRELAQERATHDGAQPRAPSAGSPPWRTRRDSAGWCRRGPDRSLQVHLKSQRRNLTRPRSRATPLQARQIQGIYRSTYSDPHLVSVRTSAPGRQ